MKKWFEILKKIMNNGGLFVLVLFLTYWLVLSKTDFGQMVGALSGLKYEFIAVALCVTASMVCMEALNIKQNLKLLGIRQKYIRCIKYAFAGCFFSGITPAATGGQPMQLYFMHKDNIPASSGTMVLLMDLCAHQGVVTGFGLLGFVFFYPSITSTLGMYVIIVWVGLILNTILFLCTLVAMFSKRFSRWVVRLAAAIVGLFFKGKKEGFARKSEESLERYRECALILKRHKGTYLLNSVLMVLRMIALNSAPFWIYKAFGLNGTAAFQIISVQAVIYVSCAALPLPGGTGISENSFLYFFKNIFPAHLLGTAMVLSRSVYFYFIMTLTGVGLLVFKFSELLQIKWGLRRHTK